MPPGRSPPIAAVQQLALQLRSARARRRATCATAPRDGGAARRGPCTVRRRGCGRSRPRPRATRPSSSETGTSSGTPAIACRTRPARAGDTSFASSRAPCCERLGGEHGGLAAGSGAQVQPPLPLAHRAGRGSGRAPRAASPRPARGVCRRTRGRAARGRRRRGGSRTASTACAARLRGPRASPGSAAIVTRGDALSAVRRASSSSARPSAASARRNARTTQTGCENTRPRRSSSERALAATRAIHSPGVSREIAPQHRVGEAGGAAAAGAAGQLDGLVDGGVGGDAGGEQLVGAEAQRIQHGRVDLLDAAVGGDLDDRVVGALAAQRAVGQLGRQRGIRGVEAGARDRLRAAGGSRTRRTR